MPMAKKKKIILIPYPAQGHVTPMLKLASVLSNFNFRPVVITPEFIHSRISPQTKDGVLCMSISDGLENDTPRDFFAIERAMEEHMPLMLEQILREMLIEEGGGGGGIACLVVDLLATWAVDVGRRCGVAAAGFWPAMHATYRLVSAIPNLIRTGVISENGFPQNRSTPIFLSSNEPILTAKDLPWLIGSPTSINSRFKFWVQVLQRSKNLRWLLTNTFPGECQLKLQHSLAFSIHNSQVLEIGPLIMQAASICSATLWEEEMSCLDWLDKQNVGSVVYVSFGSWVSPIREGKIESLALALEASKRPFLWVLGPTWRQGLPSGYIERVESQGRIVPWAPQMEVLRHQAVGCYLTHCGWNSTMEAIQCRKPLLCYPIAGDQLLNCAYIVNSWRIGVKIEEFGVEEVEDAISKIMGDKQVSVRIEGLNEKLFGKEGTSKAMVNLLTFIEDFGK